MEREINDNIFRPGLLVEISPITMIFDVQFLTSMSPDQIERIDPVTDLYTFIVAASENACDLCTV